MAEGRLRRCARAAAARPRVLGPAVAALAALVLGSCDLGAGDPVPASDPAPADVQTLPDRIGDPDLMSPDDIKANRSELAERLRTDPDPAVRADIAAALGYTARDVESIPALVAALRAESDVGVQRRLVAVLVSFDRGDSIAAVVDFALGDVHDDLRPEVHSALLGADPKQVTAALDARRESHPEAVDALRTTLCEHLPGSVYCQG